MCAAALAAASAAFCAEGAVNAKDVPPLLATDAGKTVSDAKEWESARRGELKTWFLENEYGVPPAAAKAPDVTFAPCRAARRRLRNGTRARGLFRRSREQQRPSGLDGPPRIAL